MIEHDRISEGFIILAVFIYVYLFTIAGSALVLFPLVLMISGIVLHRFTSHKKGSQDDFDDTSITNEHLWKNFIFYTVLALFGVFLVSEAITVLPLTMNTGLTGWYAFLFEALMGIAEEEFFRGFVTDYLLTTLPNPYSAILVSATFFTVYHFAVYGTVIASLLYVFAGGCILSWTAYRTLHVSPCMSGHVLNNVGAYFTQKATIVRFILKVI
jgi:hypothetical protein